MKKLKNIVCAMSGGVDSSVAALLLKKQGYHVQGVFMRNWDILDESGLCQTDQDKEDAEYVCKKIGIPFLEVNFVKQYWNNVFSNFLQDYKRGWTPNPDILCNKFIKFNAFLKYAQDKLHADAIATGHYARILQSSENDFHLLKGVDVGKDQTFFLCQIPKEALKFCIFPLGNLTKSEVKNIAANEGLEKIVAKRESAGICFIGKRNFQHFIEDYIEPQTGNFIDIESGNIVGQHKGVHCWTLGQRCNLPGLRRAYFVAARNFKTQDILVASGTLHPSLFCESIITESPYWITSKYPNLQNGQTFQCDFRFQHRKPLTKCIIQQVNSGSLHILLRNPLKALTQGQHAVFYEDAECLGSARIISIGPTLYEINQALNVTSSSSVMTKCCNQQTYKN